MTKKKLAVPLVVVAMMAGAAAGFAGMASAQTASTTTPASTTGTAPVANGTNPNSPQGPQGPHIDGNVTAINGTTITVTEEADEGGTVYAVDASGATVNKNGTSSTLSTIALGDKVFIHGTATGTNVTATAIDDGMGPGGPGGRGLGGGPGMGGPTGHPFGTATSTSQ